MINKLEQEMIQVKMKKISHPEKNTELRIGATLAVPDVLRSLGADPVEVLTEAGFNMELFSSPNNSISYYDRGRLLAHCVRRTGCEHFGLLVGQHAGLHSLGMAGLLTKYSKNVGTALRNLSNFFYLHVRGAVLNLSVEDRLATLGYSVTLNGVEANDQVGDGAAAAIFNVLQSLCGPEWQAKAILFAHHEPQNTTPFRHFFKAPLVFDAEQNAVVFSADCLKQPLSQADPEILAMLQREVGAIDGRNESLPEVVIRILHSAIITGQANEERVAELLKMHSRTLRRRLREFETSFEEILDQVRYTTAQRLLQDTGMPVGKIASTLGYSDASSFTRAFRRWSGFTPSQWRHKQEDTLRGILR
jgi:AraC-like DNA-binding protein